MAQSSGLSRKPIPLEDLLLPAPLHKKLEADFADTARLRLLRPIVLIAEWKITQAQWDRLNAALASRGQESLGDYVQPEKVVRAASLKGKCRKMVVVVEAGGGEDGSGSVTQESCFRPLLDGKRSCLWHWLADQPIELQVEWADNRLAFRENTQPYVFRARVPEAEWPEGERWCSECQTMIPLFYCRGSRCVAHASRAAHASMVKRVYELTPEDYNALLAWQRGRCYICQQVPRAKRLAVDHDHTTGEVRGLLCANDEWGCNVTLRRLLNNPGMAFRALEYVERNPIVRMREGDPPVSIGNGGALTRRAAGGNAALLSAPEQAAALRAGGLDPFEGF